MIVLFVARQSIRGLFLYILRLLPYTIATLLIIGCDFPGYGYENDDCGHLINHDLVLSRISLDSLEESSMEPFIRIPFEEEGKGSYYKLLGVSDDASTFYFVLGNSPARLYTLTQGQDSLSFLLELPNIDGVHFSPQYNRFIYWHENIQDRSSTIYRIDADGANDIPIGTFKARVRELLGDEEHLILWGNAIEDSTGIWQLGLYDLSLTQLINSASTSINYTITPDGSRIAYGRTYDRGTFNPTIYVRSTSDTTWTTYKRSGVINFSPDGKWLTFINASDPDNPEPRKVWFINLENSAQFSVGERLIENFIGFEYPYFTLNNKYVLFGYQYEHFYMPVDENASQETFFSRRDYREIQNYGSGTFIVHTSMVQHAHDGSWLYRADDVTQKSRCD